MDFDAHAHLPADCEKFFFPAGRRAVVCAVRECEFEKLGNLATRVEGIIPAFGLHPWFLRERTALWRETLLHFLTRTPRAQVGEIGLDKMRCDSIPLDEQIEIFSIQLKLAETLSVPANIHCVRAWNEMLTVFRKARRLPALHFHAFSGSAEIARELLRIADASFSLSPKQKNAASKKTEKLRQLLPPERLFAESDAPLVSEHKIVRSNEDDKLAL